MDFVYIRQVKWWSVNCWPHELCRQGSWHNQIMVNTIIADLMDFVDKAADMTIN